MNNTLVQGESAHRERARVRERSRRVHGARAFTLIDILVTIVVIGVLIGLLLPSLSRVTFQSRRVGCASNIRQIGLGIAMYADDFRGSLAPSGHLAAWSGRDSDSSEPQDMMELRLDDMQQAINGESWDGLGRLVKADYLNAPKLFYCQSHRGNHPFARYADRFGEYRGGVVANYHYRGIGPNGAKNLYMIEPAQSALVADGMATKMDYNHRVGINILRADQVVEWIDDPFHQLADSLPDDENSSNSSAAVTQAWDTLDKKNTTGGDDSGGGGKGK